VTSKCGCCGRFVHSGVITQRWTFLLVNQYQVVHDADEHMDVRCTPCCPCQLQNDSQGEDTTM